MEKTRPLNGPLNSARTVIESLPQMTSRAINFAKLDGIAEDDDEALTDEDGPPDCAHLLLLSLINADDADDTGDVELITDDEDDEGEEKYDRNSNDPWQT